MSLEALLFDRPRHDLAALREIERRVLWLAVRIVDYANRERPPEDALKVGGHQASSSSMVSLMTALYFDDLTAEDVVSVKPHAAPVLHAIEFLLGRLPREYLLRLRDFGGLQSYPSRTKDVFPVDYSTGSVGLGSVAPLFGALADRYVESHFGRGTGGRFISLLGDAELDEGSIWEAVLEPQAHGLGNALWIVDLNRQSLDRVVPGIRAGGLERQFQSAGWQVIELKYGSRLRSAFGFDGGDLLRRQIDAMPNQRYQALFALDEDAVVAALLEGLAGSERRRLAGMLAAQGGLISDLVQDLGGHDLVDLLDALSRARAETACPTVIFAYTIKGYGLPIAGRPANHSVLLTGEQIDQLRESCGLTLDSEWERFSPESPAGLVCASTASRLKRPDYQPSEPILVPAALSDRDTAAISTQAAFGQILMALSRQPGLAERIVTVSPDVSVSTNLGGWINKVGVWAPEAEPTYDPTEDSPLRWEVGPQGQHIELGISEMNLVMLLGQLGMTADFSGERLFPIGTMYDPFIARALEGLIYSVYSGSRFILAGTPSGISLSREGGAHQSMITPGIGIECPSLSYAEPCFGRELEWLLLNGLREIQEPYGEATYLRLSTKPIDQRPFSELVASRGDKAVQADVLAGAFRLREPGNGDEAVILAACGAIVPEALAAAELLEEQDDVAATVIAISSPDRLYRDWRNARLAPLHGTRSTPSHIAGLILPEEHGVPVVTIIDGASHALSFVGGALGTRVVPLGVDHFGQSGSQLALYDAFDLSPGAIATAALVALEPETGLSRPWMHDPRTLFP